MPGSSPQPYDVAAGDRMAVHRLQSAAKRGDLRAEATLKHLEQQRHTDAWQSAEQKRADREAERANRKRPGSVHDVTAELRKARTEKEARTKAALEQQT
ncbi:MAG: hypothetical protein ACR2LE_03290 [Nocardioidaceae bacterium]